MIYTEPNQALRDRVNIFVTLFDAHNGTSGLCAFSEKDAVTAFSLIRSYAAASFSHSGFVAVLGLIIIGAGITGPA